MIKMCREHFLLTFLLIWHSASANNLVEEISSRSELSKIAQIINNSGWVSNILKHQPFTVFMPTNEAMDKYNGPINDKFLEYHLVRRTFKIQDAKTPLTAFLAGNPELYLTKRPSGRSSVTGWEDNDYFINNAKVIKANIKTKPAGDSGPTQYLHIIDEVLTPTIPSGSRSDTGSYPNAQNVLQEPTRYGFRDNFSLRLFKERVNDLNEMDIFKRPGKNTFFLPVDAKMNDLFLGPDKNPLDKQVIYGHIVPGEVLFTRTSSDLKTPFKSLVDSNTLKVFIKMTKTSRADNSEEYVYYVESNTVKADPKYMKGVAQGRIVKGNIPVSNGVLHLIDRPLMMVAGNIVEYLRQEHGIMSEFYNLMNDYLPDVMTQFSQESQDLTLFAPSNSAFKRVNEERLQKTKANREELLKLINLHIVPGRVTTDNMITTNNGLSEKETLSIGRKLYFDVKNPTDLVPMVTVEGAGVNASITSPNVMASNGVVHIIDRILGIPSHTVLEKLASDPTLSSSYELIMQTDFKEELNDTSLKFTFFVPNNDAWDAINRMMASTYKKLFMGEYSAHVRQIMERHLISNQALTLDDLNHLTTNRTRRPELANERRETALQMVRQKIYFAARLRDNIGGFSLEWRQVSAEVKRPDVECVNGVIHVIDRVLMDAADVTVNSSNKMKGEASTLASIIISLVLAWSLI